MVSRLSGIIFGLVASTFIISDASGQTVIGWGSNSSGEISIPSWVGDVVALDGGDSFSVGLRRQGTVTCWGRNHYGQCQPPSGISDLVSIAAGIEHVIALRSNGEIVCWGAGTTSTNSAPHFGQSIVPGNIANASSVAAGRWHSLAVYNHGLVEAWGFDAYGQCAIPANMGPSIDIAGGGWHSIALLESGRVACWGAGSTSTGSFPDYGQSIVPTDLDEVIAVAAGYYHSIALRRDGSVVCWGAGASTTSNWPIHGQSVVPVGLQDVIAIDGGAANTIAQLADGTLVAWGAGTTIGNFPEYGQSMIPASLGQTGPYAAGSFHSLATPCGISLFEQSSGNLGEVGFGVPRSFAFTNLTAPASDATLEIRIRGDLNLSSEFLTVRLDGSPFGAAFVKGGTDCPANPDIETLTIPVAQLATLLADGTLEVRIEGSVGVNAAQCGNGWCEVRLVYEESPVDCNSNGLDDHCEVAIEGRDCNRNAIPDDCDIAAGFSVDVDEDGRPDECELDCNSNMLPDGYEVASGSAPDCTGNGVPDSCDIARGLPDCNANGIPDSCEVGSGAAPDCNGNGRPDSCDIADGASSDVDSDGIPDPCETDCNANGLPDDYEIASGSAADCNGNHVPDACDISSGKLDCDANGVPDACDLAAGTQSDCDANGVPDTCDIASGSEDKDADGALDSCEIAFGDFDLDGTIGGADLAGLLALWGFVNPPYGDLDGDGSVTAIDLSMLLARWGNLPLTWATVLEQDPDPAVVTDPLLRQAIIATGRPWRVRDNASQIEMLLIPPGTFNMGCSSSNQYGCESDENPVHAVTLTNAFYLGRYEVTQAQWTAVMGSNPSNFVNASTQVPAAQVPLRPVERVSWNMIQGFNTATGLRLPTEAEWEYAYRAGTTTAFHSFSGYPNGTNDDTLLGNIAWFSPGAASQTRPVGGKQANALGLHDMSGNVWEWVNDWWSSTYYQSSPSTNPPGPATGTYRVLRGGSWDIGSSYCRSSNRVNYTPVDFSSDLGFRAARNP